MGKGNKPTGGKKDKLNKKPKKDKKLKVNNSSSRMGQGDSAVGGY